ncbi:hypothetical protein [Marinobacterium aestuariivivens]|uniref:Uncharacterized protein n=1 Tax=Marinobacterium aestuariivivens TaxID=1698799 RepID=A0ABW2A1T6_9GAMM
MPAPLEYFAATDSDSSHRTIRHTLPGRELHRAYDDWGPVRVIEDGPRRYLSFGYGGEQSCIDCENPALPVFEYVQAMLLALLYMPAPAMSPSSDSAAAISATASRPMIRHWNCRWWSCARWSWKPPATGCS